VKIIQDVLDGRWRIVDDEGYEIAGPFDSEQDAYDYQEAWLDD
jgi:hypothetical protein